MSEKRYRICLSAPLGQRDGTMFVHESGGKVDGWLEVMNRKNEFFGKLSRDGELAIAGAIRTLVSTIHYTATGTVSGCKILLNLKTDSGAHYPVSGEEFDIDDKVL